LDRLLRDATKIVNVIGLCPLQMLVVMCRINAAKSPRACRMGKFPITHEDDEMVISKINRCWHTHLASFPHRNLVGGPGVDARTLDLRSEDDRDAA